jgi:hypothetical protein
LPGTRAGRGYLAGSSGPIVQTIGAGLSHTCAIRSGGTVKCWGDDTDGQTDVPAGLELVQITSGDNHNCGIEAGGTVACWGDDTAGQAPAITTTEYSQVAAGSDHTCGIRKIDSTVACWGDNGDGEAPPITTTTYSQVAAGSDFSCGIRTDGTLACWGYIHTSGYDLTPPQGNFTQVSAGGSHACALTSDGTATCWGSNVYGEGKTEPGFIEIATGQYFNCGLQTSNTLECWGYNDDGETNAPSGTFVQVTSGGTHSCALRSDGSMVCWGRDVGGDAPAISSLSPATLPAGTVGVPYSQPMSASGGTAPYTFTVASGSLPGGLSLSYGGSLSGTPSAAGSFPFVAEAADSEDISIQGAYTMTINQGASYTGLAGPLANPSAYGQPLAFTATVTSTSGSLTGFVTFTVDSVAQGGSRALSGGQAVLTLPALSVGSHQIAASYGGNANYLASSSSPINQVVVGASTAVTLTSSANPSIYGVAPTFTAIVASAAGIPTGYVTFTVDGGDPVKGVLTAGLATYSPTALGAGSHQIRAIYGGDSNFAPSPTKTYSQVVDQASTNTGLTCPASSPGGPIVFCTATVAATPDVETGVVTFTVDSGAPVVRTLTNGQATYQPPALSIGSHHIGANYGGDANFLPSLAPAQTVNVTTNTRPLFLPFLDRPH